MRPLPLETQTLYAELLEHLLGLSAERAVGRASGTLVEKRIKGEVYLYWQVSQPGGQTKQFYLGRKTTDLEARLRRIIEQQAALLPDLERVNRLAAQLRVGGVNPTDGPSARVLRALAESGIFQAGGVLVGTHAFIVLGNLLGVRWEGGGVRTQDLDIAATPEADIDVAVPDLQSDVPSVLESLSMGFLPVPPLNPKHGSTSFKVRGQALRVDLLSPRRGKGEEPIVIPRFKAAAQPLDYLDYLLELPERAVVIDGGAALVNVPSPARFALHKLMVASMRSAAFQTKAEKDLGQAAAVLQALIELRPGDVAIAYEDLCARGAAWRKALRVGLGRFEARFPEVYREAAALLNS